VEAESIRHDAHRQSFHVGEREATADEAAAKARIAGAEADAKRAEAQRLQQQADKRAAEATGLRQDLDAKLQRADETDPDRPNPGGAHRRDSGLPGENPVGRTDDPGRQ
jgi:hypothetical protein